jgi:DNA-binding NarL/FixJ family response regulator
MFATYFVSLPSFCTLLFVKLILYKRKPEVKTLIFVTADSCRTQVERLTQLLVSAFPGSTVYQHTDLCRVPHDVLNHRIDAVLLGAEMEKTSSLELLQKLRREKPELPVFLVSKSGDLCENVAIAGANACFVLPDSKQQLLDAMRLAMTRKM